MRQGLLLSVCKDGVGYGLREEEVQMSWKYDSSLILTSEKPEAELPSFVLCYIYVDLSVDASNDVTQPDDHVSTDTA